MVLSDLCVSLFEKMRLYATVYRQPSLSCSSNDLCFQSSIRRMLQLAVTIEKAKLLFASSFGFMACRYI